MENRAGVCLKKLSQSQINPAHQTGINDHQLFNNMMVSLEMAKRDSKNGEEGGCQ